MTRTHHHSVRSVSFGTSLLGKADRPPRRLDYWTPARDWLFQKSATLHMHHEKAQPLSRVCATFLIKDDFTGLSLETNRRVPRDRDLSELHQAATQRS